MLYHQGRTVAATYAEAAQLLEEKIRKQGYRAGKYRLFPCPVQPYPGLIWWEWLCEIREEDSRC